MKNYNKYSNFSLYKRTMPYILKNKYKVLACACLTLVIAYLTAYTPTITKHLIDDYIQGKTKDEVLALINNINILMIKYVLLTIILCILRFLFNYILNLIGMNIERNLREDAIKKVNELPVDYFAGEPDGKIVSKIISDSNGVRTFFTTSFSLLQAIVNIIALFIGFIVLDYHLALILLCAIPFILLWITLYRKKIHKYRLDVRETSSRITGKLNELITGTLIIQSFNQEEYMLNDYKDLVNRYNKMETKTNTINAFLGYELLVFIKRIVEASILLFFGINYLSVGGMLISVGLITTFTDYLDKMLQPINTIFNNLNELEDSIVASNRVYMFLDEQSDTRIFDGLPAPTDIEGKVEFRNVHFSYIKNHEVLHGINMTVLPGETIGIVGHTGSGKSSLMNLLLQYYDYQSGDILVDDSPIRYYNKASYRKNLGIVLQTPSLFAGTLKSNITLERDYSDEVVIKALKDIGASYLIDKDIKGIYQNVSFKGENYSLGEKQLIAFARILLRNPKILVLDEATANIDTETELKIKNAMNVVSQNRTTFIIAHRLSTIKDCTRIIVLDHGLIKGEGTHEELYQNCEIYKDMYDSQYKTILEYNLTHSV